MFYICCYKYVKNYEAEIRNNKPIGDWNTTV